MCVCVPRCLFYGRARHLAQVQLCSQLFAVAQSTRCLKLLNGTRSRRSKRAASSSVPPLYRPPPPLSPCFLLNHCVGISCSIVNGLQYSIFTAQHVDGCQIRAQMGETPFKKDFIDLAYELPTKTNGAANSPLSRQTLAPFLPPSLPPMLEVTLNLKLRN